MTTQKQAQIEARNNKIIRAWQKELAKPTGITKANFAAQFEISPRQLNRILDENGIPKNPEKQPTAAVSPKKTKTNATKKKAAKEKVSEKPAKADAEPKEESVKTEEVSETPDVTVVSWTITSDKFISCMLSDGEPISIETSHENYSKIAALLVADQLDEAVKLMSLKKKLQALNIRGFEISSKGIKLNGSPVQNDVVADIVGVFEREEPVEHLVKFL